MFPDLDSSRLKRSFEYFVEHYATAELTNAPQRDLTLTMAEFIDGTQDFCGERVSGIDQDLQKRNAYTLSFLRDYFTRWRSNENEPEG